LKNLHDILKRHIRYVDPFLRHDLNEPFILDSRQSLTDRCAAVPEILRQLCFVKDRPRGIRAID
jgi:hypothetical protein